MVRSRVATVAFVLATLAFAGCLGDDAVVEDTPDVAAVAEVTEETGSVTGQVITVDLDLITGAEVGLVNRTGGVEVTKTDKMGKYTFNDVKPGPYRIQIDVPCCKSTSMKVDIVAGEIAELNLQLERLSAADLVVPFVVEEQWDGFVGCDVSAFSAGNDLCDGIDANHDTVRRFQVEAGIQELVVGMEWDENTLAPDVYGNALGLHLRNENCDHCEYRYIREDKSSPIIYFLNDASIMENDENAADQRFSEIEDVRDMRWNVFSGGTNVVYQQAFTMYWYEFYHQMSPVGFEPLPAE